MRRAFDLSGRMEWFCPVHGMCGRDINPRDNVERLEEELYQADRDLEEFERGEDRPAAVRRALRVRIKTIHERLRDLRRDNMSEMKPQQ